MTVANATMEGFVDISAISTAFSASTSAESKMLSVSATKHAANRIMSMNKVLRNMKILLNILFVI